MLEIRPRIDIGGDEPGGSVQFSGEVRYGAAGTRMFTEAYEPAVVERFSNLLEDFAQREPGQEDQQGVFFSTFTTPSEYGVQTTFSWLAPEARAPAQDGWQFVGSLLFSQQTEKGQQVLSYSLFEGQSGLIIEGQAGKYTGPAPVEALAIGGHVHPGADFSSAANQYHEEWGGYMPGITNAELGQAMDLAAGSFAASESYSGPAAAIESGGAMASGGGAPVDGGGGAPAGA